MKKPLLSKGSMLIPFILIPLLVFTACQAAKEVSGPSSQTPGAVTTAEADMVFGSGPFSLLDTEAGLTSLSSYKATLTLSFQGTRDGQPSQWSKTYVMLTTKESAARQLTIEKSGDLSDLDAVFMAEANGAVYERRGENACNANVIEEGNSLSERLEPAGFLNGVIGADEAGTETVNDVAADKYTFDERSFGQSDTIKSTGEMWVASDGGYIAKYVLTTEGDSDYFGEEMEGALTWNYELTDVNQPVTITLPDDCPAGMVDAPLLPDATNILNMPSLLAFDSASSPTDAAAFYQEQLPTLGWTLKSEPAITDTTAFLSLVQADQDMTVIIIVGAQGTNVQILLAQE
jgi:hypothetical protein